MITIGRPGCADRRPEVHQRLVIGPGFAGGQIGLCQFPNPFFTDRAA